jgi:pyruvate formate lyase activating enzyme
MSIQIGNLTRFTTIDYPGKLAAVIWLYGCPMRCKYCSNPHLLAMKTGEYDPEKIIEWLHGRRGKLEAVVFSGGEALGQGAKVVDFMRRVREMGFLIGLHTNGFFPELLAAAMPDIDWVGLDFKAAAAQYEALTGAKGGYEKTLCSLDLLVQSGKPFEVRTTCDPRFVSKSDLLEIAKLSAGRGAKQFAVQKYIPHFEEENAATTPADRAQFFTDDALRAEINGLFDDVQWRD